MAKILVIDQELIELEDGIIIISDIKLPDNLKFLSNSIDSKIIAFCEVTNFILIYELVGRHFVLKHNIDCIQMEMPSALVIAEQCKYFQNLLIIKQTIRSGVYLQTVIDLETLNILHMSYSGSYHYCDGILTFPPLYAKCYKQIYHSINLADKTITTGAAPYFMENYEKLMTKLDESNTAKVYCGLSITSIGNIHYHTITGTLLGTGIFDPVGDKFYGDYFIKPNKMKIAPGAPVVEYEYKGKYLYMLTNAASKLIKAAAQHSDN